MSSYSVIGFCNVSLFTNIFKRFSGIFIEKTTFKEFVEICKQRKYEIQYKDELIDSSIDLLTNFFWLICFYSSNCFAIFEFAGSRAFLHIFA